MRKSDSLILSLAIMRKSAYSDGIQNIGGAVSALANPWIGKAISPGLEQMKGINPMWQHAQNVWGSAGGPPVAPKMPAPAAPAQMATVAPKLPAPSNFGMPGGGGMGGEAPSMLPKVAMTAPPLFPAPKGVGMMAGVKAPASAMSAFKPIGAQHRPAMAMGSRFGSSRWFMGGGPGSGNGGTGNAVPSFGGPPTVGMSGGGGGMSPSATGGSGGTTGGGDSGAAGQK